MTTPSPEWTAMTGHELLLRLAGRIPDQMLARARLMLANGAVSPAIALVAGQLTEAPIPLTADELAAIRDLAGDPEALPGVDPVDELPALPFGFSELDEDGEVRRDELDEALVAAAEAHGAGIAGVWRTWRFFFLDDLADTDPAAIADEDSPTDEDSLAGEGSATAAVDYPDDFYRPHRVDIVQVEEPGMIQELSASLLGVVPDSAG